MPKSGDYDFGNLNYINKYGLTSIEYTFDKSPFVYKVYYNGKEYYFYIIAIIHFFSMRLYGSRTYKKNLKDAEESIRKAKEEL